MAMGGNFQGPGPYTVFIKGSNSQGTRTAAVVGTSNEQRFLNESGLNADYQGKGWLMWALAKLKGLKIISMQAAGGAWMSRGGSVAPMIDQVRVAMISFPGRLIIGTPTNDVLNDVAIDTIKAAALDIINYALSVNPDIEIDLVIINGLSASSTAYTQARQQKFYDYRDWAIQLAAGFPSRRTLRVRDYMRLLHNPLTGDTFANVINSTEADPKIHLSQPYAMVVGFAYASDLLAEQTFPDVLPISNVDNKGINASSSVLNTNALMTGTGGSKGANVLNAPAWVVATSYDPYHMVVNGGRAYVTVLGGTSGATPPTHTSGTVTDGTVLWTWVGNNAAAGLADALSAARNAGATTCYVATVDRADGLGKDQVMSMRFTADIDSFSVTTADLKALLVAGREIELKCAVTTVLSTNLQCIRGQISATSSGTSVIRNWGQLDNDSDPDLPWLDSPYDQELDDITMKTKEVDFTLATGTISNFSGTIRAFGGGAGGSVVKLGRLAIEEITATVTS